MTSCSARRARSVTVVREARSRQRSPTGARGGSGGKALDGHAAPRLLYAPARASEAGVRTLIAEARRAVLAQASRVARSIDEGAKASRPPSRPAAVMARSSAGPAALMPLEMPPESMSKPEVARTERRPEAGVGAVGLDVAAGTGEAGGSDGVVSGFGTRGGKRK